MDVDIFFCTYLPPVHRTGFWMVGILRAGNGFEILKYWLRNKIDRIRSILKAWFLEILNNIDCYINDTLYRPPRLTTVKKGKPLKD